MNMHLIIVLIIIINIYLYNIIHERIHNQISLPQEKPSDFAHLLSLQNSIPQGFYY